MKRAFLLIVLAALSIASGVLMSESSWIGKVGMTFFHKGYNLTKVWWQGATAVFIIQMVFFSLHSILHSRLKTGMGRMVHILLLLVAAACLYLTYDDFHHDFTHRLLKHRFHYGVYLVWIGWMVVSLFFIFSKSRNGALTTEDRKVPANQ